MAPVSEPHLKIASTQQVLPLKVLAQPHLPLAQSHKHWRSELALPAQTSIIAQGSLLDVCRSPDHKMHTSHDNSQKQEGSLKAAAHPHLPLALLTQAHKNKDSALAFVPQSANMASGSLLDTCQSTAPLKVQKSLDIASIQKVLALKALAHTHLPLALLAQAHKDWYSVLPLPPQSSNISSKSVPDACQSTAPSKMQTS